MNKASGGAVNLSEMDQCAQNKQIFMSFVGVSGNGSHVFKNPTWVMRILICGEGDRESRKAHVENLGTNKKIFGHFV